MKAKRYIEMSAAKCPETQLHIPEEPNTILVSDRFLLFTVPEF